jgi:hypothetical protein
MDWVTTATASTLTFELKVGQDYVVADPSSLAVLKVRKRDGSVVHTETIANPTGSVLNFTVPDTVNTLSGSNTNELRSASLEFVVNSKPQLLVHHYKVSQYLPFTVTAQTVRTLLGLSYEELEDHEVDLLAAYYALENNSGTTFTTAFTTEGFKGDQANLAVCYQAAIDIAISLPQRIAQKNDEEKASFQRLSKLDPYKLIASLDTKLAEILDSLQTEVVVGSAAFVISQPTDAFTGA